MRYKAELNGTFSFVGCSCCCAPVTTTLKCQLSEALHKHLNQIS